MNRPFTASQFLDVISQYNATAWPAQVIFYGLAALMIYWAARTSQNRDRWPPYGRWGVRLLESSSGKSRAGSNRDFAE